MLSGAMAAAENDVRQKTEAETGKLYRQIGNA